MPTQLLDYFANLVADDNSIPLTEASIAIAQDAYPDLDVQGVLAEIDTLAFKLNSHITTGMPPLQKLRLLNQFFYTELGFQAHKSDFYDPNNLYLHQVLKNRRGLGLALAILYMEIAQQIGLPLRGILLPKYLLVRLTIAAGDVFIDPQTGNSLTKENLQTILAPYVKQADISDLLISLRSLLRNASTREILTYLLRSLKEAYLQDERWERLLGVQQRLVILLPNMIEEIRDRGLAYANLEYFRLAKEDLESYLRERPNTEDAEALNNRISQFKKIGQKFP